MRECIRSFADGADPGLVCRDTDCGANAIDISFTLANSARPSSPTKAFRATRIVHAQIQKGENMKRPISKKWASTSNKDLIPIPGSNRSAVPNAKLVGKSDYKAKIKVSIYARLKPTLGGGIRSKLDELNTKL